MGGRIVLIAATVVVAAFGLAETCLIWIGINPLEAVATAMLLVFWGILIIAGIWWVWFVRGFQPSTPSS